MFETGRVAGRVSGRVAVTALCVVAMLSGCSGSDDDEQPDKQLISTTTMRGAFLQATEVGPSWTAPDASADPNALVSVCGGTTPPPEVPPGGQVITAPLIDEGDKGAQSLEQIALVYGNKSGADAALAGLRGIADGCQKSVSVPATVTSDRNEPAYVESVQVQPLQQGNWSGFVVIRHKTYDGGKGTADTAVAIIQDTNVVLVDAYAIYRLDNASTGPSFDADWQKLVGTVVQRVG